MNEIAEILCKLYCTDIFREKCKAKWKGPQFEPSQCLDLQEPIKAILALIERRDKPMREENENLKAELLKTLNLLKEAKLQIEYLHGKFKVTGSGNAVIARLESELAQARFKQVNPNIETRFI